MKRLICTCALVVAAAAPFSTVAAEKEGEAGFKPLFNGKDLTGWAGRPQHWSVEDGAITGRTTREHPAEGNNFLIWRPEGKDGVVSDFELRLSYKIVPNNTTGFANSGIQYRSKDFGNFVVGGYQADFEAGKTYSGILYEERMDGILAQRGQKTVVKTVEGKTKVEVVGSLGASGDIQAKIHDKDWNDYVVIAKGNHLQHFINGVQTVDVVDERTGGKAAKEGVLALQLHAGEPMTVQFKDIRIKETAAANAAKSDLEQLQGEWVPVEIVANGDKASQDALDDIRVKITGNRYSVESNNPSQGTFKIVEGSAPKQMDVTGDDGTELPAIYEVSGDTFKACYSINGASRPTEFKSAEGSDHVFAVYKRKSQ
ncbi:MAG TPA: family 16 glycoside hydrolase [Candidatus Angelobacter sp.]|nr:family 16 glycoside hydrolase [Candidatus Angelobacter sp.]